MNPTGKGGFKKGQSGNPSGRPKEVAEVRDLARQYTKLSIERLVHWAKSDDPRASVAASAALLDRAWGKPGQPMEHNVIVGQVSELLKEVASNGQGLPVAS